MKYNYYLPEGSIISSLENISYISNIAGLESAMKEEKILEATAIMCDQNLNLHIDLGGMKGIIPKEECLLTQNNEAIKDIAIITRVGKPVCFKVKSIEKINGENRIILSRKAAQIECRNYYLSSLISGDIIPATVTHLDNFGAFVDIGCGISSLLSIDCISISRISHPSDRLFCGQKIDVIVKSNDTQTGRIYVTLKELLGSWEENANNFSIGQTVFGVLRSIENYGVFVELAPNLAGLAELREDNTAFRNLSIGDTVTVYIKNIIPDKMKIKLVLIDIGNTKITPSPLKYYINTKEVNHISAWRYTPERCEKVIESIFE